MTKALDLAVNEVKKAWQRGQITLADIGGFSMDELDSAYNAAVKLVTSGQSAAALQVVGTLLLLNPRSARFYQLAGVALHALKRYELAEGYYRMASALAPLDPIAVMYRGETNLFLGNRKLGFDLLRRGIAMASGRPELETYLQRARAVERAFLQKQAA